MCEPVDGFIGRSVQLLILHGWSVEFSGSSCLHQIPGDRSSLTAGVGMFDDVKHKITVACGYKFWVETFVHEMGHFKHWLKTPNRDYRLLSERQAEAWDVYFRWVKGKRRRLTERMIWDAVRAIVVDEAQAEKHALNMIRCYDLPIDRDLYIKWAGGCLLEYAHAVVVGKTISSGPGTRLYERFVDVLPSDLSIIGKARSIQSLYRKYAHVFDLEER